MLQIEVYACLTSFNHCIQSWKVTPGSVYIFHLTPPVSYSYKMEWFNNESALENKNMVTAMAAYNIRIKPVECA